MLLAAPLAIPEALASALAGRYTLERALGRGGMATVYLARDIRHDRQVAVKVLRPDIGAAIGADRFLNEIHTTAALQHPHLLPLFDSGAIDGVLFYVMPYVEGESLQERLTRNGPLPTDQVFRIAREVGSALDYAHRRGVIHRDVKPANILLHEEGALLADFGIARATERGPDARLTGTGLSLGTPQYMSPEQAAAERDVGPATDIYSLGAVVYEMLSGTPPFDGPSMHAVLAQLLTTPPPSLTQALPDVAPATNSAIQRALAKRPADRFATCAEFVTALRNGLASSLALPAMKRPVVPPPARRIPRWAIVAGLIAVGLIIGYVIFAGAGRGVGS